MSLYLISNESISISALSIIEIFRVNVIVYIGSGILTRIFGFHVVIKDYL